MAKLDNAAAKKQPEFGGVCDVSAAGTRDAVLRTFPIEGVRGIGPATAAKLAALGLATAAGLRDLSPKQARAVGTVTWSVRCWSWPACPT